MNEQEVTTKKNVDRFDDDVRRTGSYAYTAAQLSSRLANGRISEEIARAFDFRDRSVLDLGCGDGTYTLELANQGGSAVLGLDPAAVAIEAATAKARERGLSGRVKFEVGNIYALDEYLRQDRFDCIVLRGVLHHLPDPERAIAGLRGFRGAVVVLEPNGNNPVLKLLERFSRYHIEHEERSFSPARIESWLKAADFRIRSSKVFNLIPMFCPDWMASTLRIVGPPVEHVPLLRDMACGQSLIVAAP
jgi:2-polyprenyl-3-methyl-5-hydroxy-6-metoxy-1,4-benzoquinol methylase